MSSFSLRLCFDFLLSKWKLLSFLNLLFFGVASGMAVLASVLVAPTLASGQRAFSFPGFITGNSLLLFLFIFFFNLAFNAFTVVTLPGFLFFPVSAVALAYRAVLWGLLLYVIPSTTSLILLPVVVLEGEAYVIAALAGMLTGFSWVKPEEGLSRLEAFKKALKQCSQAYIIVAALLFVAAVVETTTITLLSM